MVKRGYVFLLFLKNSENKSYLFFKNYYLFTLFLKIVIKEQLSNNVENF